MDIIDVTIDMAEVTKQIADATKQARALKDQIRELTAAEGDNTEKIAALQAQLAYVNGEKRKAESLAKNIVAANKAEAGSHDDLAAQLAIVTSQWRNLSAEERKNTEEGRALVAQKKNLADELNRVKKEAGDTTSNIGRYKESIIAAYNATDGFGGALGGLPPVVGQVGTALKALAATPLVAVLTLIAAGMTALIASMGQTQKGADRLAKATAVVGAVFDTLVGAVGRVANKIVDAFANPQKAIMGFGKMVKEFVVDRFNAALKMGGLVGDSFKLLFEGKFSEAATKASEAGKIFTEMLYPLTAAASAVGEALGEAIAKTEESAKAALKAEKAQIALEKQQAASAVAIAAANRDLQKQTELRDADTRTLEERYAAGEEVLKQTEKFFTAQLSLAKAEKLVADERRRASEATGLAKREEITAAAEAKAKVIALEGEKNAAIIKAQQELQLIKQDAIEQDLDVLINFTASQTGILKAQADDARKSYAERIGLIDKAKALNKAAFDAQIASLDELAGKRQELAKLAEITDARTFNAELKKLELSEIGRQRVLEAIPAYQQAVQDLADAEVGIQQEKLDAIKEAEASKAAADLEAKRNNTLAEFDFQRAQLAEKERLEIESATKIGLATTDIQARYSDAKKKIDKAEFEAKLSLAQGFFGNLAQIFGEQTAAGKAAAVAQTAIATYQSATESYKSLAGIPFVGPVLGAAAAAVAIKSGFDNVKKIMGVKSGLPGDSAAKASIPGGAAPVGSVAVPQTGTAVNADLGRGIVSRGLTEGTKPEAPTVAVVTDQVTASQSGARRNREASIL